GPGGGPGTAAAPAGGRGAPRPQARWRLRSSRRAGASWARSAPQPGGRAARGTGAAVPQRGVADGGERLCDGFRNRHRDGARMPDAGSVRHAQRRRGGRGVAGAACVVRRDRGAVPPPLSVAGGTRRGPRPGHRVGRAQGRTANSRLHTTEYGDRGPVVLFCHGLFGQGRNWTSIAKTLAADGFRCRLVDLPNHGRSAWTEHFSYGETAELVAPALGDEPAIVVGHSLGGKVAMRLALDRPDRVGRLCVVDMAPVRYQRMSTFADYIAGMQSI